MNRLFMLGAAGVAAFLLSACAGGGPVPQSATLPQSNGAPVSRSAESATTSSSAIAGDQFNNPGNVYIADQFNNRVIEVNPSTWHILWEFDGALGTNDAERIWRFTLIAGTGVPAANPPFEPGCTNGCPDNRVMLVDKNHNVVWQYGQFGVTGSGPNELNTPVQNTALPNGHVLITDQGNQRVIEVNVRKQIVWQYGTTGVSGIGMNQLNNPNSAELLNDGTILISDESNNRVIQVNRAHQIVWQYPQTPNTTLLNGAAFASRLPDGHTLITDSNNNRAIEVDMAENLVWKYSTLAAGGNPAPAPTRAIRLSNGNTLISDQFNDRVIEVTRAKQVVYTQGMLDQPGRGFDQLNAPYDAKVVGDYTGLTNPLSSASYWQMMP